MVISLSLQLTVSSPEVMALFLSLILGMPLVLMGNSGYSYYLQRLIVTGSLDFAILFHNSVQRHSLGSQQEH